MDSLSLRHGFSHMIKRNSVYQDVIDLYDRDRDLILTEYPFRIKFAGEKAIDVGGVTRDMFSAFFEEAYLKFFDGASLLTPTDFPKLKAPPLSTLGFIISHAYLVAGMLPIKIAFPSLASMLLPSPGSLPDEVSIQSFIDSLSCLDAKIFRDTWSVVKQVNLVS